jgi:hypothetical protein
LSGDGEGRFLGSLESSGVAEKQISPLRCAPVELTMFDFCTAPVEMTMFGSALLCGRNGDI